MKERAGIQSVEVGFALLDVLAKAEGPLMLRDLAAAAGMSAAVLQTLGWTGALIVLVLAARRPVARTFGPQYAYALWALPFIRLVLPPLTLPAWMAPAAPVATRATLAGPLAWPP